jgi:hypothetical protein
MASWRWGDEKKRVRQERLWTPTAALPVGVSHPFYQRLNQILEEKRFDEYVETICQDFYAGEMGRPGLSPGINFGAISKGSIRSAESHGAPAIVCRFDRSCGSGWMKACRIIRPSREPGG